MTLLYRICKMVNFKYTSVPLFGLILLLAAGCDPIYNFRSKSLLWEIKKDPTEIVHVDASGHASLSKVVIIRSSDTGNQRLLLMINSTLPDWSVIQTLYGMSLDSLARNNYVFDTRDNAFYTLGLIDIDQDTVFYPLDRPMVGTTNYIFGIPSDSNMQVQVMLDTQKLADTTSPVITIMRLPRN